ncbi:MAG: ATP-binding cassette domain-containing protein [Thermodesulfobacteriota bacterium]
MSNIKFELRDVGKSKNGNLILREINLKFLSGKKYNILGPSGAGKTTLLRLLNRMDDPTAGDILIDEQNILDIPVIELRKKVGMVFQIPVTFDGTVRDNLMVPYELGVVKNPPDESDIKHVLKLSELKVDFLERKASDLSVGEKQRLSIARTLINKPEVLLLDEPTSALDHNSAISLLRSISQLNSLIGITVIMVTHQLAHARFFGGQIIQIDNGVILQEGLSEDFFRTDNTQGIST